MSIKLNCCGTDNYIINPSFFLSGKKSQLIKPNPPKCKSNMEFP